MSCGPFFYLLWIDELAIRPDDPESEQRFRTRLPVIDVKLAADIAAANRHELRFLILQELLKTAPVGGVMACGVSPARVYVTVEAHDYAVPYPLDPAFRQSAFIGPCRILWMQPGTGLKRALVQFPVNDASRLLIENASGEAIIDGYACMVDGSAGEP
ncbi:MAG: hypothetical protein PHN77_23360 [Thermoguttaceae bacterium]|nr:hypothetical protein [Thermoguttaceae bacterium]